MGAWAAFAFSLLAGGAILALGKPLLGLYGPEFAAAFVPLVLLIGSQIVNSLTGSVGFILTMTGHEKRAAAVTAAAGVLHLSLAVVLIPRWGLVGAAVANSVAAIAWNLTLLVMVWRTLAINPTIFQRAQR
jgi:O-antigen/teichoic acid export membrane protein